MGKLELRRLSILMIAAFVDMVGFALVLPLLPLYAESFGIGPLLIGILLASFAVSQLLTSPLWGKLSDRVGRRPVILGGQSLSAVAFLLFAGASALAHEVPESVGEMPLQWGPVLLLLLSRLAQGAGGGSLSAVQAYVSDAVQPEERAKALGWITACTSAGVMLGPAIGSLSLAWTENRAAPGLIAAGLCVLNVAFGWRWLPESTSDESRAEAGSNRRPLGESVADVVRHPAEPAHVLIGIYAIGMLAFMSANAVFSLYLAHRFGIGEESIGWFFSIIGFFSVVMRGLILGIVVKHFGEVRALRFGLIAIAAALTLGPFAWNVGLFLLAILFLPTGTALLFPSTTSLISRFAKRSEAGQIHGVQQAFGGVSRIVAPVWALAVYGADPASPVAEQGGFAALDYSGALPFWLSAVVVVLCWIFSFRLRPNDVPEMSSAIIPRPAPEEGDAAASGVETMRAAKAR